MKSGNAPVNNEQKVGLLFPLPLLPGSGSDHQAYLATVGMELGADLRQQVAQECTIFGFDCLLCKSHLCAENKGMLANEARSHFFVQHAIVVTWLVLGRLLDGDTIGEDDFIFV